MGSNSSRSSFSLKKAASNACETTTDEKVALTSSDSDALNVDFIHTQTTNTENVLDFTPIISQLICGADFLLYLNLDELLVLSLLSKNISMLTRNHISKNHTCYFNDYSLRDL
eukprot:TRINITY_DN8527_c0_g1_i1.p1 TRINITY_DN8527_c0_g1~~TRINITY_DN8527_c0_g1_i1.p1  ORF type:complete len:113 (-),score=23.67 TRINITY_DN8527_c0_g1_i1:46-384(-)